MNKGDLVNEVAKVVSTKKRGPGSGGAFKKKDMVALIGFGTFKVQKRNAKKGINPQTREEIKIKAKKVPKFVPGKALKDAVLWVSQYSEGFYGALIGGSLSDEFRLKYAISYDYQEMLSSS